MEPSGETRWYVPLARYSSDYSPIIRIFRAVEFDGLFLSNGPGDHQSQCPETIQTITSWLQSKTVKPIFGICLGHQVRAQKTDRIP